MTELILLRHGETDWNGERRLQGHVDIPLNGVGRRQAQAAAAALADCGADHIVSSDLGRAAETAAPIGERLGLKIEYNARLRERCYGAFEGLLYDDIAQRYPDAWTCWQARDPDARFPRGEREAETLAEFVARISAALADIAAAWRGGKVILVTHGGFLDGAYRLATAMAINEPRKVPIRNASINRLRWDHLDGLALIDWGDTSHLDSALDELPR